MSEENIRLIRRNYEVINSIGRTSDDFVDPEEVEDDEDPRLPFDVGE